MFIIIFIYLYIMQYLINIKKKNKVEINWKINSFL